MAENTDNLTKADATRILRRLQSKRLATMSKKELELAVKATTTLLNLTSGFPNIKID